MVKCTNEINRWRNTAINLLSVETNAAQMGERETVVDSHSSRS